MPENNSLLSFEGLVRLSLVADRLCRVIDARLARGEHSVPQQRVLCDLLAFPASTDRAVASRIGMSSPQLSRIRKALVDGRLVNIAPSPDHKSQSLLTLSGEGEAIARPLSANRDSIFEAELLRLAPDERQMIFNAASGLSQHDDTRPKLRALSDGVDAPKGIDVPR